MEKDPEIIDLAIQLQIFNTSEDFTLWLITPNSALGNKTPNDLAETPEGKEQVIKELTNMQRRR
jgi:uncharacterized protein (DUF2384 family)